MEFGQRIKAARVQRQLTQDQVADKFFITRQTISNWENEKSYPDMDSLIRISNYYHISLDTLLKEDTGMREYLEKKEIKKNVGPVYDILLLVYISLYIINTVGTFTEYKLGVFSIPLFILFLMLSIPLSWLMRFDELNSVGLVPMVQRFLIKHQFIIPGIFTIVGVILLIFKSSKLGLYMVFSGMLFFGLFARKKI